MSAKKTNKPVWGEHQLSKTRLQWRLGELNLVCQKNKSEIRIAAEYNIAASEPETENLEIEESLWQRWTLKKVPETVSLRPALPPLPCVVTPEQSFQLVNGVSAMIYTGVPLWIQVLAGDLILFDGPAFRLSKTWFGNFLNGEMCYWVSTAANTAPEPLLDDPLHCICPVEVTNKSDDHMQVEKICLRTDNLAIYQTDNALWSNHTRARYTGNGSGSDIDVVNKAPKEVKNAKLLTAARVGSPKGFRAMTFATLKEIPGFGIF